MQAVLAILPTRRIAVGISRRTSRDLSAAGGRNGSAQRQCAALQKPHPPVHDGGAFPYGVRPAIRYGDGLIPIARGDVTEVLAKFRDMAREAGRDPASIEITSFGVGEDLDRVKRLADLGVARVVASLPSEKAAAVLPIVDRWTAIMRHVNG